MSDHAGWKIASVGLLIVHTDGK